MPELPDLEVFSMNLKSQFVGKKLEDIKVIKGEKLKDSDKQLSEAFNKTTLQDVYRSGKELRFKFQAIMF